MYQQRNRRRSRNNRNNVSFRDPLTVNAADNSNSSLHRFQQFVNQQSPSTVPSVSSSSSPSIEMMSASNIQQLTTSIPSISLSPSNLPQHLQILMHQSHQLLHNQSNHHYVQRRHHRHRKQQQENKERSNHLVDFKPNMSDFERLKIKNKATSNINWNEWNERMEAVMIDSHDTNQLILDYFINDGQHEMASIFCKETGTNKAFESENGNGTRSQIKECIHSGQMLKCIDLLKQFSADFFVENEDILLLLQKQHLIECIHRGHISDAYEYNSKYLLPKTKRNSKLLMEIGDIFACIACRNLKTLPSKQRDLLSLNQRLKIWQKINRILVQKDGKNKFGESLLYQNVLRMNYYQNFLTI